MDLLKNSNPFKFCTIQYHIMAAEGETFAFQAEINQLLSLIINTFYSNKDIFLRELISNASDALDKVRYELLSSGAGLPSEELKLRVCADKETGTITIEDNGIGMSREELVRNLGTIAHSGTRSFMEALKGGVTPDIGLIGQFGVGFYSAFLVADKVKVISKAHGGDEAFVWESNAGGTFTVTKYDGAIERGTQVVLQVKEEQKEYLEDPRLREIINKHSQYIGFPIYLREVREEEREVEEEVAAKEADAEGKVEDVVEGKAKRTITETVTKWEHINKQIPIWTRKPDDVKPEEYAEFYKSLAGDWEDHLAVKHFSAEGQVEFKALLYVPPRAPYDMFTGGVTKKLNNIKLYVRKVLIMDETNDLVPEYLQFLKGVVDSDDLPLNVSREMLQQNSIMRIIKKNLVKKGIDLMFELADGDAEKWKKFYSAFGKNIKLGIVEDGKSREKLKELLRFSSTKGASADDWTSLKDYVTNMKEGQKDIYYVTGESYTVVKDLPCMEKLKKKGYEVLFLVDPMDEYMIQHLQEYNDKKMVNCSREGFVLEDEEVDKEAWEATCKKIQEILKEKVKSVKVSSILVSRPCLLLSDQYGWTANMERIMKAQALRSGNDALSYMISMKKVLEINPNHAILKGLKERIDSSAPEKTIKDIVELLYETVMIDSGYSIDDPAKYCNKIYRLLELGLKGEVEEEAVDAIDVAIAAETATETTLEEVD